MDVEISSRERDALWYSAIKTKYGLHKSGWNSGVSIRATYHSPWKFISSLYVEWNLGVWWSS
ncbi:hypothetical protein PanWU01x14_364800, partial [Parasponia andersonii]